MNKRGNILHVTESFGAGVASAIHDYVAATPDFDHYVLRALRAHEYQAADIGDTLTLIDLPNGLFESVRILRKVVRRVRPAAIHVHSSKAGVIVRASLRGRLNTRRVIYSPHCFAFERTDLTKVTRGFIRTVEAILAYNTFQIAACSKREQRLARSFRARRAPVYVPNVAPMPAASMTVGAPSSIVTIGRASAQKDPMWFASLARELASAHSSAIMVWVGDGEGRALLERAGVHVTGWLSREEATSILASAAVYVHSGLWEGFPLSVLEACAAEIPIVVRDIPAFDGMPDDYRFRSTKAAAAEVQRILSDNSRRAHCLRAWKAATALNRTENQRSALLDLYVG